LIFIYSTIASTFILLPLAPYTPPTQTQLSRRSIKRVHLPTPSTFTLKAVVIQSPASNVSSTDYFNRLLANKALSGLFHAVDSKWSGCQKQAWPSCFWVSALHLGQPKISQTVLMSDVSMCQCFEDYLRHLYFRFFFYIKSHHY